MEELKLNTLWNNFHYSCVSFYGIYGLLCMFAYRPYSKYVYFKDRWQQFHSEDEILEYFAFGAGECCLVMSVLTIFCFLSLNPTSYVVIEKDLITTKLYCLFQVFCWIMWTLTELYYTCMGIEWPIIGFIHVVLCSYVLRMSINNFLTVRSFSKRVVKKAN